MEWTPLHDLMLLRETAYEDPFQFKKGSPDRGEVWSKIARSLNSSAELGCFDTVFRRPYRYFCIPLKGILSVSNRHKIFASD